MTCTYQNERRKALLQEQPCNQTTCVQGKLIITSKGGFCDADPDTYNLYCHTRFLAANNMPLAVIAPSKENFTFTPQDNEECPCLNCDYLLKDKHDPETCGPEQIRHCPIMDGWLDKRLKRQA
jgi:hypothetical protein